jgi:cytoskeletal protein CcmA (bactofilin family)
MIRKMGQILNNQSNFAEATLDKLSAANRKGAALLIVLFIVMAITILSLGFLSRSDVELACGRNMDLRMQMDYLAESGLEHARGLILNPQDVDSEYWTGADAQQLVAGSDDYYDIDVVRDDSDPTDRCNYIIDCNSYRLKDGEKIGRSNLSAQLRIDPAVCYWVGSGTTISERATIKGDVYCAGNLWNGGVINGDVFADGAISGTNILGRENGSVSGAPVAWPDVDDFRNRVLYGGDYYVGTTSYSATYVGSYGHPTGSYGPSSGNPADIRYRSTLQLSGSTTIEGTIVTNGLQVSGTNNVITATKNFPAIVIGGDLKMYSGSLVINGLAIVEGEVLLGSDSTSLTVTGGLYVAKGISELAIDSSGNFILARLHYSPTWRPTSGQSGGALEFDGIDDYAQTTDSTSKLQLSGDYTLSIWIYPNSSQKEWAGIISKCDPTGSTSHWTLQFDSSSSRRIIVRHPSMAWDTGIRLNNVIGAWHHIAVIRSGNTMAAYLDGVPYNSGTFSYSPGSGDGHLNIGCDKTASSSCTYSGLIDGIRMYNQAHNISDIYPPRSGIPGLIGLFRLDEGGTNIQITVEPITSAIRVWPDPGSPQRWSLAAGAFFKSMERQ